MCYYEKSTFNEYLSNLISHLFFLFILVHITVYTFIPNKVTLLKVETFYSNLISPLLNTMYTNV